MKKVITSLVVVFTFGFLCKHFFTKSMIVGTYVNRNYENDFIGETPHIADTLILFENNKFVSPYYGQGTYELSYTLGGTKISLDYGNGSEQGSFETSLERIMFFGNLKINLNQDLNQYYEKIK